MVKQVVDIVPTPSPEAIAQWEASYAKAFKPEEIAEHDLALRGLTPAMPAVLLVRPLEAGLLSFTFLSRDYSGLFALITGLLGAAGYNIERGESFTSRALEPSPKLSMRRRAPDWPRRAAPPAPPRWIVDRFIGRRRDERPGDSEAPEVDALREDFVALLRLIESGGDSGVVEARRHVNESVARRLATTRVAPERALYPVRVRVSNRGAFTRLIVTAQDTPFFLYAFATALALRGIRIEAVRIDTRLGHVRDTLDVLDAQGRKITAARRIAEARFCALLTKQFTYFLGVASNPHAALERFEQLTEAVFQRPERGDWMERFSDPQRLRDLARILGASDFLWEDFIRGQYESLGPLLDAREHGAQPDFSFAALRARRDTALSEAESPEGFRSALNQWKDKEMFHIDLEHILHPQQGVRALAEPLTRLAECALCCASARAWDETCARHGTPRTVGGLPVAWALFGLGKMGGVALGYASDIELLFVYDDAGRTDGDDPIEVAEFFERFVERTVGYIDARREGVFEVDLRLRPYGVSGPRACRLERFCEYYGPGGPALAYERLALTRLRAICGDAELGARVERLRDEFLYCGRDIALADIHELRERQHADKSKDTRFNAKFGAGALVDIEYCVQMLQVVHGGEYPSLRTPRIHTALESLAEVGVLDVAYSRRLIEAYDFLRRLINGLRMLRGNARDLLLPEAGSLEYLHLARRMGYRRRRELDTGRQLTMDFATHTAVVRAFIGEHFGHDRKPDATRGNIVDLMLAPASDRALEAPVLGRIGLHDTARARINLRSLAGDGARRERFLRLAVLAADALALTADPDMALNNWERIVASLSDADMHFGRLLLQPRRLEVLLALCATSQFLSDALVRHPECFDWATDPRRLQAVHDVGAIRALLERFCGEAPDDAAWLDAMRRFRRRELVRIGVRDLCLHVPLPVVAAELSALAEAIVDAWTRRAYRTLADRAPHAPPLERFSLLAFGKLGGNELNYSSDIDLLGVFTADGGRNATHAAAFYARLMNAIRDGLNRHTAEGYAYRVDLRLRPHGGAGPLVVRAANLEHYYRETAAPWERQALLKLRPIAGGRELGRRLARRLSAILRVARDPVAIAADIARLRATAEHTYRTADGVDVKNGPGGIRDIEFLVQALQLAGLSEVSGLAGGNTLEALDGLRREGRIRPERADRLALHYAFLRRLEHLLQLADDRQTHILPDDPARREAVARRLLGREAKAHTLTRALDSARREVRAAFEETLELLVSK